MAQTVSSALFQVELRATLGATRTSIGGSATVGDALSRRQWTDCDLAYSFALSGGTAGDTATLTLSTGAVAATSGSPLIVDGGVDHEGNSLVAMVRLYAIYVVCTAADNALEIRGTAGLSADMYAVGDKIALEYGAANGSGILGTVTFAFGTGVGQCDVVVFGRTT